jgi:hypothetical protein
MGDLKSVLERGLRGFEPSDDAFERTLRRRERKRRNQRITAGVVGIAVFVAAIWIVTSVGSLDRGENSVGPAGDVTGPAVTGPTETVPPPLVEPVQIGTVTRSGAGCELEITAEPILSGPGRLSLVNDANRWVRFELYRLDSRSSFARFEAFVEAFIEAFPARNRNDDWPPVVGEGTPEAAVFRRGWFERELAPGASGTITDNVATGDAFAVVCLDRNEGPGFFWNPYWPFAVVGPIVVP